MPRVYRFDEEDVAKIRRLLADGLAPAIVALRMNCTTRAIAYYAQPTIRVPLPFQRPAVPRRLGNFLALSAIEPPDDEDVAVVPPDAG